MKTSDPASTRQDSDRNGAIENVNKTEIESSINSTVKDVEKPVQTPPHRHSRQLIAIVLISTGALIVGILGTEI